VKNEGRAQEFNPLVVDWTEAALSASLQSVIRKRQIYIGLNDGNLGIYVEFRHFIKNDVVKK